MSDDTIILVNAVTPKYSEAELTSLVYVFEANAKGKIFDDGVFPAIRACITDAFRFRVEIEGWREQLEKIATTWDVAQEMAIDKLRRSLANENDGAIVQRKNPESESPEIAGSTPASPMTLGEK